MTPLLKNLLIALVFAILLWVGYRIFFADGSAPLVATPEGASASEAARESRLLLRQVRQLREVEFDTGFFADGRFRILVDHRQRLFEEPVGRDNPFSF